jgi:exonuclease SbcC
MVIFNELEMDGFKRYGSHKTYKFNKGLVGIFGKNESGKSTIGDAISVALFGLSTTTYKKADIVTWGRLNAKIRLDFETDIPYRVERTLGNKSRATLKKYNNNRWEVISKTIKNVDSQVQDILGLDYKSFKNSIFIGQNELNSLSSLSKNERQTIINRLSRYDELTKAEGILKEDLKEKRVERQILEKDFEGLDKVVSEKKDKNKKLKTLNEDYTQKNRLRKEKNDQLKNIQHKIRISEELKKITDTTDKINGINNQIGEKVQEISRIEGKESDKKEYEEKLVKLEHLNVELEETVEEINGIVTDIGEVENRQNELKELKSLINEKDKEISRIEGKESDKEKYEKNLEKLKHFDQNLKNTVENIEEILSQIKQNNNDRDKVLNEIEGFEKDQKGLKTSIEEKDINIHEIEGKEKQIEGLKEELDKFHYHTPQLKIRIEEISGILSKLTPLNIEFDRINREKSEIGQIKDEKELRTNFDKYEEILGLEEKLNTFADAIESLEKDIKFKKEQLGDLKEEKGDLAEIEKKYESDNSKATIFIVSGIFISLLGVALGFLINLFLIILLFIGLIPLYKGYKDRNYFKRKLDNIKEKREFFGQLKQLEIQINEKKDEHKEYLKKLDKYKDLDRQTLKKDHQTYKNLENQIKTLKKLEDNRIDVEKSIVDLKKDLRNSYEKLPEQYKQDTSITDLELDKKLSAIYQEDDKEKSSLNTSIKELNKEIPKKSKIVEDREKLKLKKQKIKTQIEKEQNILKQIHESEGKLDLRLKEEFEILPTHYKEEVSIDDENLDKKISKIYQEEDKAKSTFETSIRELNKEISRKPQIIKDKEELETENTKVEKEITNETQHLIKKLEDNYNLLPAHYKEEVSIDDENLDKKISKIYQEEDKAKSTFETSIRELNKEISRKPQIIKDKEELETEKESLKNKIKELKTSLLELTDGEDLEYDPLKHQQLEIQENDLDNKIKKCLGYLGTLQGEIKTLEKDTDDLEDKIEELDGLINSLKELNFEFDVMDIARKEIANTAKMLREQVMERTRKHVYFLLPRITNNKYRDVKIDEAFKIEVYSPEKNEFESINSLSGGAKDQVLFAIRLAFTNAIIGGRSRSKGFALFLDEFLGSFDQNRRDETLKMLRDLKQDFRQIFLITHIDGMEGNVDQVIKTPEI